MIMLIFGAALLVFLVVLLVVLARRRKKSQKEAGKKDVTAISDGNGNEPIVRSVKELIPLQYYDEKNECYVSGTQFVDIIRIQSKDLVNMSEEDVQYDILRLSKWYKTYSDDIKIVSLNFPADTRVQQEYLEKKLDQTNNPQRRHWIERKMNEEVWLGNNKMVREYYIIFFSKSADDHTKNKNKIISALQTDVTGLVEELNKEQKDRVWRALCNKYTVLH